MNTSPESKSLEAKIESDQRDLDIKRKKLRESQSEIEKKEGEITTLKRELSTV